MTSPQRLGELLTEDAKVEPEKLERALRLQRESGERIGALLVQLGLIAEHDLADALSRQLGLPLVQSGDYRDVPVLDGQITPEFMLTAKLIPLSLSDDEIVVAMADPLDQFARHAVELATGRTVSCRIGVVSEIEAACREHYGDGASSMEQIILAIEDDAQADPNDVQQLKDLASEAPIIRVVNLIIARALKARASDIHLEPFENRLKVRYRVDGVMRDVEAPPAHSSAAVVSRIKVMAKLNIAERRLPQDGRIKLRIEGRELDLRISTVPTMHGESVVLRILDKTSVPLEFPRLGFTAQTLPAFEAALDRPYGIILVTGPTGSGKTTTLYAALQRLNTPERKILTVEDPVEYQLEGINQIQIKPQIGLSFAHALRSILRQDPDVIMVGEMRDLETAKIAVQSALTGHKVFSTVHTNDSASSITRLLDMGIEDFLLTSTVTAVLAQRLVRALCEYCKEPYDLLPGVARELGLDRVTAESPVPLYRPGGCSECEGTGFRGRTGILELLTMSDPIRETMLKHADAGAIRRTAVAEGMTPMYEDGLRKAVAGVTTVEEVVRVTREA